MKSYLINCDCGEWESSAHRDALLPHIDLANIACGGHAGDRETIADTMQQCARHGVLIGAHPGLGGSRISVSGEMHTRDMMAAIDDQLDLFDEIARSQNQQIHHVKLHGALYHASESRADFRAAFLELFYSRYSSAVALISLAGGELERAANQSGIPVLGEAFLDRGYQSDGSLVPRDQPGAMITSIGDISARIALLRESDRIVTTGGNNIIRRPKTLCIHADTPQSIDFARIAKAALDTG